MKPSLKILTALVVVAFAGLAPMAGAEEACTVEECYYAIGQGCGGEQVVLVDTCVYKMDCGHGEFCHVISLDWCVQNC